MPLGRTGVTQLPPARVAQRGGGAQAHALQRQHRVVQVGLKLARLATVDVPVFEAADFEAKAVGTQVHGRQQCSVLHGALRAC